VPDGGDVLRSDDNPATDDCQADFCVAAHLFFSIIHEVVGLIICLFPCSMNGLDDGGAMAAFMMACSPVACNRFGVV
jgi:hypothetical protein